MDYKRAMADTFEGMKVSYILKEEGENLCITIKNGRESLSFVAEFPKREFESHLVKMKESAIENFGLKV